MKQRVALQSISTATLGVLCMLRAQPAASQERRGVIPHAAPAEDGRARHSKQEVAVYEANMLQADQPPTLTSRSDYLSMSAAGDARRFRQEGPLLTLSDMDIPDARGRVV